MLPSLDWDIGLYADDIVPHPCASNAAQAKSINAILRISTIYLHKLELRDPGYGMQKDRGHRPESSFGNVLTPLRRTHYWQRKHSPLQLYSAMPEARSDSGNQHRNGSAILLADGAMLSAYFYPKLVVHAHCPHPVCGAHASQYAEALTDLRPVP